MNVRAILGGLGCLCALACAGCGQRLPVGEYVDSTNFRQSFELKADNTYLVSGPGGDRWGEYAVDGREIVLKTRTGTASRGTISGDSVTFRDGTVFIKRRFLAGVFAEPSGGSILVLTSDGRAFVREPQPEYPADTSSIDYVLAGDKLALLAGGEQLVAHLVGDTIVCCVGDRWQIRLVRQP